MHIHSNFTAAPVDRDHGTTIAEPHYRRLAGTAPDDASDNTQTALNAQLSDPRSDPSLFIRTHGPLTASPFQRMAREAAEHAISHSPASHTLGGGTPSLTRSTSDCFALVGSALHVTAQLIRARCESTLEALRYEAFASTEERVARAELDRAIRRFRRHESSRMPAPPLRDAVESLNTCLSALKGKAFSGSLTLLVHPMARFLARDSRLNLARSVHDHEATSRQLASLCKAYQERVDDHVGTEHELLTGDYAASLEAVGFLWREGVMYCAALDRLVKRGLRD